MATKEFIVLDTENRGIRRNGDKVLKQQSLGGNKRLSDITNSLSSPNQDQKQNSCSERDYIEQLLKENVALRKLIAERKYPLNGRVVSFTYCCIEWKFNGTIHGIQLLCLLCSTRPWVFLILINSKYSAMSGVEIKKMRETMQKLQQQNWQLAQANSKMLMEVNIGKDRLKAMHHELGCMSAMVKSLQLQERTENEPCQKAQIEEVDKKLVGVKGRRRSRIHYVEFSAVMDEVAMESKVEIKGPSNSNRRRQSRVHSVESSAVMDEVVIEDKAEVKGPSNSNRRRQSRIHSVDSSAVNLLMKRLKAKGLRRKSPAFTPEVPDEPTDEKAESKRVQLRRHSTRLEPQQPEPAEDLFEIEDAKFPVCLLIDQPVNGSGATSPDSTTIKKAKKRTNAFMVETPEPRRASVGRPMRSAAVKVQSYKEVPRNVKMRRA